MGNQVSIKGLSKAKVLAALYNASRPQGMGFMHYDPAPMGEEEAEELLSERTYFDYLKGRVMKISLSGDSVDPSGYDRDNGRGAVQQVVSALRQGEPEDGVTVSEQHEIGKSEAVQRAREGMSVTSTLHVEDVGGEQVSVLTVGLGDVADVLGPKIDEAEG